MPCYEGVNPNHFVDGSEEDSSPGTTYVTIENATVKDTGSTRKITFEVNFNPAHPTLGCSVNYQTSDDTAIAGTHYTTTGGTLSVLAEEAQGTIDVPILGAHGDYTNRQFTMSLTAPSNCVIVDNTATGTIKYDTKQDGTEANKKSRVEWVGWPVAKTVFYEQFSKCASRGACTAYAGAAMMSALEWKAKQRMVRFNADKLFTDAGGTQCTQAQCGAGTCPGWYSNRVLAYAKATGIQMLNYSSYRQLSRFSQIQVSDKSELISRIKAAIFNYGVVYIDSTWYSNWNTAGMNSANNYIMPIPQAGNVVGGHSYVLVGWKKINNRNCFVVQNSSGKDWAKNGRAFLPFSYIDPDQWLPSHGHPWFRFYKVIYGG